MAHTAGPWHHAGHGVVVAGPYADENEPDLMLEVVSANADEDGRLVAAAPDLLEALEDLQKQGYEGNWVEIPLWLRKRIAAALAKAKGEPQP